MERALRVLLVDDDAVDRKAVRRALRDSGLAVELLEHHDPLEAEQALTRARFDCVLLDYNLPRASGLEVLRRMRAAGEQVPVIMLTGQGDEQLVVELMKAGAVDYLSKAALSPESLARAVLRAVELYRAQESAREAEKQNAALHRIGSALSANLDLDDIVQKVTDEATALCGAQIGAFFYNVVDEQGERFMLYALSGVERTAFEHLPMPRNTQIFGPTFSGTAIVRSADITQDPRYGQNAPNAGMPKGHFPVRSYVAVPVVSRSSEVLGGLFFGHMASDVFTQRDERLLEGIAGQAALAIDNARLYQASQRARVEAEADRDRYRALMIATKEAERSLELLANAGKAVVEAPNLQAILGALARIFVPEHADWASIVLRQPGGAVTLATCAAIEPWIEEVVRRFAARRPIDAPGGDGSAGVLRTGESRLMREIGADDLERLSRGDPDALQDLVQLGVTSALIVPLTLQGRLLGTLSLGSRTAGKSFGPSDVPIAEEIGRRAAAAIDGWRLFELSQEERRRAEEANRAKDEFLAVVSHEMRTPLNAILGWASMLRMAPLSDEQRQRALETIERNAKAQAQLIEDLLDVSRIITGKLRIEVGPVDIVQVVEAALDVVRPAAEAKEVRLQSILDGVAGPLMGDADRLQQVVWNLLSNAVKFTSKGGRVLVRMQRIDSSVVVSVEDTGQGIDPAFLSFVFDRFRQADMATTRVQQGLGLGLAIARHIAELHGGAIEASSEGRGRGATFTLRLPVSPLRAAGALAQGTPVLSSRTFTGTAGLERPREIDGLRILVVDDEPDARELLASVLAHCNADVQCAASAEEAFAALGARRPDVVISDIGMPGEDGYALIARLRALEPAAGGLTPAIALTAFARSDDRKRALRAGFDMHLAKPIDPGELIAVVASVAGRSSRRPPPPA